MCDLIFNRATKVSNTANGRTPGYFYVSVVYVQAQKSTCWSDACDLFDFLSAI